MPLSQETFKAKQTSLDLVAAVFKRNCTLSRSYRLGLVLCSAVDVERPALSEEGAYCRHSSST